jgi:excisionase family DNA binding protein
VTTAQPGPHPLITVVEVANALRVSRATVYRLVRSGVLPGKRVGKSVRVARRVVEQFLHDADAPP